MVGTYTMVLVGTYTRSIYLFGVNPAGQISSLGASELVPSSEPLVVVPDVTCDSAAATVVGLRALELAGGEGRLGLDVAAGLAGMQHGGYMVGSRVRTRGGGKNGLFGGSDRRAGGARI